MPKSNGTDKKQEEFSDIPHTRNEPRPDFSTPPPHKKLPKALQDTLDNDEKLWEALYEGHAGESTDSNVRYAAYAARIRTLLLSAHRYVAYTSDIGESFRPVAHPWLVKSAYGISWAYLAGDVAHEGYKAYLKNKHILYPERLPNVRAAVSATGVQARQVEQRPGFFGRMLGRKPQMKEQLVEEPAVPLPGHVPAVEDYRAVMAQRAVFQSIASMGLPAFTIHSIVKYSGRAMKDLKSTRLRTWGPIGLGLAAVPFLPFVFDEPVERAVEWAFHKGFETFGGPEAVGSELAAGKKVLRHAADKGGSKGEKEL